LFVVGIKRRVWEHLLLAIAALPVAATHGNQIAAKSRKQAQLGEPTAQVRIVEGYYDLDTGKIEWTAKQANLMLASLVRLKSKGQLTLRVEYSGSNKAVLARKSA